MDLDALSRSPDGERRVTVTARALLLTRDVRIQDSDATVYRPGEGHVLAPWHHDTTYGGLGLDADEIASWHHPKILDVASGLGVAATELSELGAEVDCVDLEFDDGHPSFAAAAEHVRDRYAAALGDLAARADAREPRYALPAPVRQLLARLQERAETIATTYPRVSGRRQTGDATTLADQNDATYDVTLCGWLMVHLDPDAERRAIASMLRVTKPGGHLHIRAGYGGDAAPRVHAWFPDAVLVHADEDLVVLRRP